MNKKVLIPIIAVVAVVIVALIVVFCVGGKDNEPVKKDDATSAGSSSSNVSYKDSGSSSSKGTVSTENVEVKDVEVKSGDSTVKVPIYLNDNPGLLAAQLVVSFDTEKFDYADCEAGDLFDTCIGNFKDGKISIIAMDNNSIEDEHGNGVIANIILNPKGTLASGTYTVTVEKESEYANANEEMVNPTVEAGKIVVK